MKYEYWFANIKGIGNQRKQTIRQGMKLAEQLYYIEETALSKMGISQQEQRCIVDSIKTWELQREYEQLQKSRAQLVTIVDPAYPKRLLQIKTPPYALYVRGELPREDILTVAIVGARECSSYGEEIAKEFGRELAKAGIQVVSGMARGVDAAGQWGTLSAGGKSFAVLGCGVDVCYPKEERKLYERLQMQGGILSEFPPGTKPLPQHFPARNRIISGLADAVLVIEAKEKSGSLITVDMALEQGKDVYALPGPVTSHLSRGCNELIRQGAGVLITPQIFLEDLGICMPFHEEKKEQKKILLESTEKLVYSCLDFYPKNIDRLILDTKVAVAELMDVLMRLELQGYIREISKNNYMKIR